MRTRSFTRDLSNYDNESERQRERQRERYSQIFTDFTVSDGNNSNKLGLFNKKNKEINAYQGLTNNIKSLSSSGTGANVETQMLCAKKS